jgi:hypothetical protein
MLARDELDRARIWIGVLKAIDELSSIFRPPGTVSH